MTRKTPVQRLRELELQETEIKRKAKEKKAQITALKRREQSQIQKQKRKDENRRKILIGAAVQNECTKTTKAERRLMEILNEFLVRDQDRAMFDHPPADKG